MTDADRKSIVRTVQDRHAAVGRDDRAALAELLCADFHAFESGQRMGGAELLDLMTKMLAAGKRYRWSVTEKQVRLDGDLEETITSEPGAWLGAQPALFVATASLAASGHLNAAQRARLPADRGLSSCNGWPRWCPDPGCT